MHNVQSHQNCFRQNNFFLCASTHAAVGFRLDGDNCSLLQPMFFQTDSLITQLKAPVFSRPLTDTACGGYTSSVLRRPAESMVTCILSTDFLSFASATCTIYPSCPRTDVVIRFVDSGCGCGCAVVAASCAQFLHLDS